MSDIRQRIEELESRNINLKTELAEIKLKHRPIIQQLTSQLEDARLRKKAEIGSVLNQLLEVDEELASLRAVLSRAMQETLNMPEAEVSDVFK